MSINATVPAAKGPEIGSEEWVAQKLGALGTQGEELPDESDLEVNAEQTDDEPVEATANATDGNASTEAATAPSWREAMIPENDDTVPQHFRGKRTADVWDSYRHMERAWNEQQQKLRELEAKVAAKETFKEILAEQQRAELAAKPVTPSDQYRESGIDLETDPILHPTKFFPKQEQMILEKAKQLVAEELAKREAVARAQHEEQQKVQRVSAALGAIEKQRGLNEAQMKQRIPSIMMTAADTLGPDALADPEALLKIHDSIFGYTAPAQIPAQQQAPNPPGVKRAAAVEPAPRNAGPQLKTYEREILSGLADQIKESGFALDPDRLAARYAANLKRTRG